MVKALKFARYIGKALSLAVQRSTEYARPNMTLISAMAVIGFPLFYIIWAVLFPQPYENIGVRLLGSAIFLPLVFHKQWSVSWHWYLPYHWALAFFYGSCFFFPFMLFKNQFNEVWTLSALVGSTLLVLVAYNFLMMVVMYLTGLALAWLYVLLSGDHITLTDLSSYCEKVPIYLFIFAFGAASHQNKERILQEKHRTASSIGGAMAHEIRTPLLSIRSAAEGFKRHLPTLMQAYGDAQQAKQRTIPQIHPQQYHQLAETPAAITRAIDYASTVIDMLLANSKRGYLDTNHFQQHTLIACVESALAEYPFKELQQQQLVTCALHDFTFWGSDTYLKNVLFNLLSNALYFIAQVKKGHITLTTGADRKHHLLYFKDTSKGIKPDELPHIFSPFYSKGKQGGTGIGLSFCQQVMTALGGDIRCQSVYGEYTQFILAFPKIKT